MAFPNRFATLRLPRLKRPRRPRPGGQLPGLIFPSDIHTLTFYLSRHDVLCVALHASRDVATFFRVLQRHYLAFVEMMRFQLTTRAEFERLIRTDPATLTDLERAARFFYLQRTAFGGKVAGRTFGVSTERAARFDITRLAPMIEDVHERLAGVTIECLDFREFLARYDRAGTLFYLDPPYWGSEGDYGKALFRREDFADLAASLRGLKGRFILSLNDRPEVREIFSDFKRRRVATTYGISRGHATPAAELLITNLAR